MNEWRPSATFFLLVFRGPWVGLPPSSRGLHESRALSPFSERHSCGEGQRSKWDSQLYTL